MLNTLLSSFYAWFLFLFVLLIPFFLPLWIRISFHNLRKDNIVSVELEIKLFKKLRLFLFKKIFSSALNDENLKNVYKYLSQLKEIVHRRKLYKESFLRLYDLAYLFASSLSWQRLDIFCKFGTGDPASTAILTGSLRFLASVISYRIYKILTFSENKPRILIYPFLLKKEFIFFSSFEINTSGARIFLILLNIAWKLIKEFMIKKYWRWVRNVGSSYSRLNDDSDGKFKRDG
jgi:hypothetical protein